MPDNILCDLPIELIQEITSIVFDYPGPPLQPCDVIFVFGGSHPGLWQMAAEAYHKGLGKIIVATGVHRAAHAQVWWHFVLFVSFVVKALDLDTLTLRNISYELKDWL